MLAQQQLAGTVPAPIPSRGEFVMPQTLDPKSNLKSNSELGAQGDTQVSLAPVPMAPVLMAQVPMNVQGERGEVSHLLSRTEQSPLTLKTAASSNTVSALTGLKPWSKEWVFGNELGNFVEDSKTLNASELQAVRSDKAPPAQGMLPTTKRGEEDSALSLVLELLSGSQAGERVGLPLNQGNPEAGTNDLRGVAALLQGPSVGQPVVGGQGGVIPLNKGQQPSARDRMRLNSALSSGGDFLSTLNAARSAVVPSLGGGAKADDFLSGQQGEEKPNLRVIEGGMKARSKSPFGETGETLEQRSAMDRLMESHGLVTAGVAAEQGRGAMGPMPTEVTGHVIKGANAEDRFSSESLFGITNSIRNFTAQGGGEMRIHLKPENLGELHVRVMTDGHNVGLHIQASDERSKRILEESISHLKETLATQNLSLGAVDLTVAQAGAGSSMGDQRQGSGEQHSAGQFGQGMQDLMGQQNRGGNFGGQTNRDGWSGTENDISRPLGRPAAAAAAARSSAALAAHRLDVQA